MIEFTKAFKASDGKAYTTLEEAQRVELVQLFDLTVQKDEGAIASRIIQNKGKIVDILTTTESSRPKARKANGATKKRQPKPTITEKAA